MCISICGGVLLWNGLEENMKLAINADRFEKIYKKYIFSRYTREGESANCSVFDFIYSTECKLKSIVL